MSSPSGHNVRSGGAYLAKGQSVPSSTSIEMALRRSSDVAMQCWGVLVGHDRPGRENPVSAVDQGDAVPVLGR